MEARFAGVLGFVSLGSFGELPPGSLAVLRASVEVAEALNLTRPALLERGLRVVIFAEGEGAGPFRRAAPDLASWIQQSFAPEPEPTSWVRAGLRRALAGGGIGLQWRGGDLDAALAAVGAAPVAEIDGTGPYPGLVAQLRASPPGLVRVVGAHLDLPRLGWALAEAGREGTALWVDPGAPAPGW